jgi:hypothetical protein
MSQTVVMACDTAEHPGSRPAGAVQCMLMRSAGLLHHREMTAVTVARPWWWQCRQGALRVQEAPPQRTL